jgi:hypothetical protein
MLRTVAIVLVLLAAAAVIYVNRDWVFAGASCDSCGARNPPKKTWNFMSSISDMFRPPAPAKKRTDPRVMNPKVTFAPAQFEDPRFLGAFGVSDVMAPAFADAEYDDAGDDAEYDDDAEYGLVKDGEILGTGKGCMPQKQLSGARSVMSLPMRSVRPEPQTYDLVEEGLSSLPAGPVDLVDAKLTPPGMARPSSEWAFINYNSQ